MQWIETAEDVMKLYKDAPVKYRNATKAFYRLPDDSNHLPPREAFISRPHAIHTEMHEEGHSSGSIERLNRIGVTWPIVFGSPAYRHEELVWEMSALIRSTLCQIDLVIAPQSLAYLKWRNKDNKHTLAKPFNEAQTAADYMLGLYTIPEEKKVAEVLES